MISLLGKRSFNSFGLIFWKIFSKTGFSTLKSTSTFSRPERLGRLIFFALSNQKTLIKIPMKDLFEIPSLSRKKVKKGDMFTGLVVRTKAFVKRSTGGLWLMQNAVILLDKKMQPLGTRMFGPVAREVKVKKYNKLATIARFVV